MHRFSSNDKETIRVQRQTDDKIHRIFNLERASNHFRKLATASAKINCFCRYSGLYKHHSLRPVRCYSHLFDFLRLRQAQTTWHQPRSQKTCPRQAHFDDGFFLDCKRLCHIWISH